MNKETINQVRSLQKRADIFSFPDGKEVPQAPEVAPAKFTGVISGPMWESVSKLNSNYVDNFDWSIYDKLYARFGENQPRGGVVFKTTLKMVNHHSQCSKCHYSLEIDTYGRGCVHNCVYCYAKDQLTLRGYWNRPYPMPVDLVEVRKIFHTVFETDKKSKWRTILEKRVPIRLGSMSDSFMWMDKKYGVTLEFLKILKHYKYPYVVFTRSDLVAEDSYIEAMDKDLAAIQFSISGENEELTRAIEPGAPSVKRRLQALKTLASCGFWTTVRLNPLFPMYPDGYFSDRQNCEKRFNGAIPTFPILNIDNPNEFMGMLKEANVPSIVAGFVRLNQTSISQLSKATNTDLKKFFAEDRYTSSGESHYSDEEIRHYYNILFRSAIRSGIRFTTCYIGNGIKDYYQYQNLWSNKGDCCDVLSNVSAFKTTSQSVAWAERHKHAPEKSLSIAAEASEKLWDKQFKTTEVSDLTSLTPSGSVSRIKWAKPRDSQPQV